LINQIATSAISLSLFRGVLQLDIIKLIVLRFFSFFFLLKISSVVETVSLEQTH